MHQSSVSRKRPRICHLDTDWTEATFPNRFIPAQPWVFGTPSVPFNKKQKDQSVCLLFFFVMLRIKMKHIHSRFPIWEYIQQKSIVPSEEKSTCMQFAFFTLPHISLFWHKDRRGSSHGASQITLTKGWG